MTAGKNYMYSAHTPSLAILLASLLLALLLRALGLLTLRLPPVPGQLIVVQLRGPDERIERR